MSKRNNQLIVEHYKKRFAQIMEYTMRGASDVMTEDGEDTPENNTPMGDDNGEMPQNNDMETMTPDMGNGNTPPEEIPQGDNMNMNQDDMGDDITGGFNPQGVDDNMGGDDTSMMQPDDEVVDITDLTDAQEETQEEIEQFDSKFAKAIEAIKSLENMIKTNDEKIDALQDEIKRRNPTPIEKMSNRASNSYPFNISPNEYWSEKEKTSNYSTEDDNNGKNQEQYTITNADINNMSDWKSISDTLSNDFIYNQTLEKLLNM